MPHVAMTCGKKEVIQFSDVSGLPARHRMKAVSTAGAGDAYGGGRPAACISTAARPERRECPCAQEMGAAFAEQQAVLCRHTIDPSIDRQFV